MPPLNPTAYPGSPYQQFAQQFGQMPQGIGANRFMPTLPAAPMGPMPRFANFQPNRGMPTIAPIESSGPLPTMAGAEIPEYIPPNIQAPQLGQAPTFQLGDIDPAVMEYMQGVQAQIQRGGPRTEVTNQYANRSPELEAAIRESITQQNALRSGYNQAYGDKFGTFDELARALTARTTARGGRESTAIGQSALASGLSPIEAAQLGQGTMESILQQYYPQIANLRAAQADVPIAEQDALRGVHQDYAGLLQGVISPYQRGVAGTVTETQINDPLRKAELAGNVANAMAQLASQTRGQDLQSMIAQSGMQQERDLTGAQLGQQAQIAAMQEGGVGQRFVQGLSQERTMAEYEGAMRDYLAQQQMGQQRALTEYEGGLQDYLTQRGEAQQQRMAGFDALVNNIMQARAEQQQRVMAQYQAQVGMEQQTQDFMNNMIGQMQQGATQRGIARMQEEGAGQRAQQAMQADMQRFLGGQDFEREMFGRQADLTQAGWDEHMNRIERTHQLGQEAGRGPQPEGQSNVVSLGVNDALVPLGLVDDGGPINSNEFLSNIPFNAPTQMPDLRPFLAPFSGSTQTPDLRAFL